AQPATARHSHHPEIRMAADSTRAPHRVKEDFAVNPVACNDGVDAHIPEIAGRARACLRPMIERSRIATYGISTTAVATIALALWLKPWQTTSSDLISPPTPPVATDHRVDIVFAVDTTGSMGGLIEGAKRTVWSIATHVREIDPQADLRVGLVAYKDMT